MDQLDSTDQHPQPAQESPSIFDAFACETPAGKVFWLHANQRRPGCRHPDQARALATAKTVQVWIFTDPGTPERRKRELADQVRRAVLGTANNRWRFCTQGWIARRLEHVFRISQPINDADELLLAIMDAYPIAEAAHANH